MSESIQPETVVSPSPRRRSWRPIVVCAILFLCGVVVGAGVATVVTLRVVKHHFRQRLHHPDRFVDRATRRLTRRLDLSEEQSDQVRGVLRKHHESLLVLRREVQPQFEAKLAGMKKDVKALLTPEQAEQFELSLIHI